MKMRNILVIAALIATSLAVKACGRHCVSCDKYGVCQSCLGFKLKSGKCVEAEPITNDCLIQSYDSYFESVLCTQCKVGFSLARRTRNCWQGRYPKCLDEYTDSGDVSRCAACEGSSPNQYRMQCVEGIAPNCLAGAVGGDRPLCAICKAGYTSVQGKCKISQIEGCMETRDDKVCDVCDYTKGYYATEDNESCNKQDP